MIIIDILAWATIAAFGWSIYGLFFTFLLLTTALLATWCLVTVIAAPLDERPDPEDAAKAKALDVTLYDNDHNAFL